MVANEPKKASAGRILIKPRGEWNANVTYEMLDLVNHNGYAFLAKRTVIGIEPSDDYSQYWHNMLDIKKIVENHIADTVADDVGDVLSERFRDEMSEALYVSDLMADFTKATFVQWNAETENTPYKEGLTECTEGFAHVFGNVADNHTIVAWTIVGDNIESFNHCFVDGEDRGWNSLFSKFDDYLIKLDDYVPKSGGTMNGPLGLGNGKGTVSANNDDTYLESTKDSKNYRRLKVNNNLALVDAIKFLSSVGGEINEYTILGEHNVAKLGIAKIKVGYYDGNGTGKATSGVFEGSVKIPCDICPKMIIIQSPKGNHRAVAFAFFTGDNTSVTCQSLNYDSAASYRTDFSSFTISYDKTGLVWNSNTYKGGYNMNKSGVKYVYALLY